MNVNKLTVVIEADQNGYKIVVPGMVYEQKCVLHASKQAKEKAVSLLLEAIKELRILKVK